MSSSFLKYFSSFGDEDRKSFFSYLFLLTLLGNSIVFFIGFLLKDIIAARYIENAPTYAEYMYMTGIVMVANTLFELFLNYSRIIMHIIFPTFLREVFLRVGVLFLIFGYSLQWWSFDRAVIGLGIIYVLSFLLLFSFLVFNHNFRFNFSFRIISKEVRRKLIRFGGYAMLLAGSFAIVNNISNDQLTAILGADMAGIFNTCFFIAVVVELPRRNMANVIAPMLSKHIESKSIDEVEKLYKRSSITMSVMGALIFIGITTNISDLFEFIPKGESFQLGFWIVICVCIAKFMNMIASFSGEIINFSSAYRFNLFFQLIAAISLIGLNYYLIPIYGLNGAAISYLITILLHILMKGTFVWLTFGIHPFSQGHIKLSIIVLAVWLIASWFDIGLHPVFMIGLRAIVTTLAFTLLIYKFNISKDINLLIQSTFERFLKIKLPK